MVGKRVLAYVPDANQYTRCLCCVLTLPLLLLLLLLLHHDASLQPTCGGPPPMDEQDVSATTGRVGCALVWSTCRRICGVVEWVLGPVKGTTPFRVKISLASALTACFQKVGAG